MLSSGWFPTAFSFDEESGVLPPYPEVGITMADKLIYGCVESGTYRTTAPSPHIDLAGALSGYGIRKTFGSSLIDGDTVTVTIRATEDSWAVYSGAAFLSGSPDILDLSSATLLASSGTVSDGTAIGVMALGPDQRQFPALFAPTIGSNALVLNLRGLRETYHRVSLSSSIDAGGITLSNAPASGVIKLLVEFIQSGGPHTVPITAWSGIPGVVFDTPYQVYIDSTPTIVTLLSLDGGNSWRAGCNAEYPTDTYPSIEIVAPSITSDGLTEVALDISSFGLSLTDLI
jgi:hypothetical protein